MPTLTIPETTWQALAERAAAQKKTVEQLVLPVLDGMAAPVIGPPPDETAEEWIARLRAYAASHPKRDIVIDDDRDTIYGGPDGRGTW